MKDKIFSIKLNVVDLIYIYVILLHIVAALQDIKKREISDLVWICVLPVTAYTIYYVINSDYAIQILYLTSVIFGCTLSIICFTLRLIGGADVKSITLLSITLLPLTTSGSYLILKVPSISIV